MPEPGGKSHVVFRNAHRDAAEHDKRTVPISIIRRHRHESSIPHVLVASTVVPIVCVPMIWSERWSVASSCHSGSSVSFSSTFDLSVVAAAASGSRTATEFRASFKCLAALAIDFPRFVNGIFIAVCLAPVWFHIIVYAHPQIQLVLLDLRLVFDPPLFSISS